MNKRYLISTSEFSEQSLTDLSLKHQNFLTWLGIIQKVATVFYSKWPLSFQLKWPVYTGKSVHLTDL